MIKYKVVLRVWLCSYVYVRTIIYVHYIVYYILSFHWNLCILLIVQLVRT